MKYIPLQVICYSKIAIVDLLLLLFKQLKYLVGTVLSTKWIQKYLLQFQVVFSNYDLEATWIQMI